jgi:hypothetical protein
MPALLLHLGFRRSRSDGTLPFMRELERCQFSPFDASVARPGLGFSCRLLFHQAPPRHLPDLGPVIPAGTR